MPQATTTPRSTERGLALLRVVADHAAGRPATGLALADAARAVELSPSTAMRQLRSLEAAGFVTRDDEGRYLPGAELLRIARSLTGSTTLPRLAEGVLDELAAATGESAYLAEPDGSAHAVYVAMASGHHAVRHVSWLGNRVPRKGTAVGAALAGKVAASGVAVRIDAVEDGITAVSAPVRDDTGRIVAAVSVVGLSFRQVDGTLKATSRAVAHSAAQLTAALGGTQPTKARTGR